MFWTTFCDLCKQKGVSPTTVVRELGMSTGSITSWKKGVLPNGGALKQISEYFGVTIEQLVYGDEISIHPNWKKVGKIGAVFKTLYALPQRFLSLRSGNSIDKDTMDEIMHFTHCGMRFFYNPLVTEYVPDHSCPDIDPSSILRVFCKILDVFDSCADSEEYRDLQILLSRVVLYNVGQKGYTEETLTRSKKFDNEKLHFIYTGEKNKDTTKNYGLNYSDLTALKELTDLEYFYMFTGDERKVEVILK